MLFIVCKIRNPVSFYLCSVHNNYGYAILVREEFSCLEFIMNRDTINWILK